MSHSSRFILIALAGWVGFRALSLGLIPGGEALAFDRDAPRYPVDPDRAALPAIATTQFAPLEPLAPPGVDEPTAPNHYPVPLYYGAGQSRAADVHHAVSPAPSRAWGPAGAEGYNLAPAAARYAATATPLDQWPIAAIASGSNGPAPRRAVSTPAELIRSVPGIDRLSMSGWAMMRRDPGSPSLATNGQLGGSQAGARLLWRFNRSLAASLRTSAPIGGTRRNAELAAGVRWQPFASLPVALTAERRQSFGRDKGASAFALFAEGGVYDRPIVAGFNLDAYLQAGMVGVRDHAAFVDGSATLTRPVWRQLSAGVGIWGGAQPGLARFDAGPRLSWRLGTKMRVHLDYRQRLLGRAAPGSGPVLTLAGDF